MVDIGVNDWSELPSEDSLEQKGWPSKSIGIYYTQRKSINEYLSFYYGIGLGLEKISLGNERTLYSFGDSVAIGDLPVDLTTVSVDKNRLAMTYLDIPVEFRYHLLGTQDGEGLFIGFGGIFGMRLNSHTKWKYSLNGENVRIKSSGKFNLNPWRYGIQVRAGFKGFHFFYKQYMSDAFSDPLGGANPQLRTIGVNFTGF